MILIGNVQNLWTAVAVITCSMSVLKIQKQSHWGFLWKRAPINYRKFTGNYMYQSLYRLQACNFIKKNPTGAYYRHLLCMVPAHNAFSSLNLLFFIHTAHMPCLSKIFPPETLSGELCKVFKNTYFVEPLQTTAFNKTISYICSFN